MAQKSKTQRAKASAARSARKEQQEAAAAEAAKLSAETADSVAIESRKSDKAETGKSGLFGSSKKAETPAKDTKAKETTKAKPKKERFKFLKAVRAEMKRVTWPTRTEVLRWSGVVVFALLFFGIYVAILDNWIVTPILVGIAGLGA